jgi:prepilin-type N-terminal cleavage/methylation domain-containing protein
VAFTEKGRIDLNFPAPQTLHAMTRPFARPRAFTLVEVMMVMAVIGVLVGLMLPAVQAAREAARRSACSGKLSHLGLAIHNYHSAHDQLPNYGDGSKGRATNWWDSPSDSNGWRLSFLVGVMPFMEQQSLWNQIQTPESVGTISDEPVVWFSMGPSPDTPSFLPWQTEIPSLRCPSDVDDHFFRFGRTNYVACLGDSAVWSMRGRHIMWMPGDQTMPAGDPINGPPNDSKGMPNLASWANQSRAAERGVFVTHHRCRLDDVTDGLSNTIMGGEISTFDMGNPVSVKPDITRPPNTLRDDRYACSKFATSGVGSSGGQGSWVLGLANARGYNWADFHVMATGFHTILPPGAESCSGQARGETGVATAGSGHQGGTHVLMGDGAVIFMTQSIEHNEDGGNAMVYLTGKGDQAPRAQSPFGLWGALGTRASGEIIDESF